MISKTTEKVIKQLKKARLSTEDRIALTTTLLNQLGTIPVRDVLTVDPLKGIQIKGKTLDIEQAVVFRDSCVVLKDNPARILINEQLTYEALKHGIHNGLNTDMIMFSKAVLWVIQEEEKLIKQIV